MLRTARVSARLEGTQQELLAVATDLTRYAAWVPGIERCQVLTREGDVTLIELRAPGWDDRSVNLEVLRSATGLAFRQIDSLGRPEISGQVEIGETAPDVGATSARVQTTLQLETPFWSLGARRRMRTALRTALDALGVRRRQLRASQSHPAARRQKVLEVVREARGLRVWYMGETFRIPKVEGGDR
ncbi:MAG: hypothetical protein AAF657_12600 [Acidobacteriota bacterium]